MSIIFNAVTIPTNVINSLGFNAISNITQVVFNGVIVWTQNLPVTWTAIKLTVNINILNNTATGNGWTVKTVATSTIGITSPCGAYNTARLDFDNVLVNCVVGGLTIPCYRRPGGYGEANIPSGECYN